MSRSTLMANGFTVPLGWLPAENDLKRPRPSLRRIDSASTERAVFPVQRNRTLNVRSGIGFSLPLRWTTRREAFNQRRADFRSAVAAIIQHEQHHRLKAREIGAVDNRTADAARGDEPGARQHGEMRGHRVLRNGELLGDLASREPLGLVFDEQPENLQPGGLRKRGQCKDGGFGFHISRLMDISASLSIPNGMATRISIILEIPLTAR